MPRLMPGDPAPWFFARSPSNNHFKFDTVAGRYVVLCFFGSAADEASRIVVEDLMRVAGSSDEREFIFFGISNDPDDELLPRVKQCIPGLRLFWDFDNQVCGQFGLERETIDRTRWERCSIVLDLRLRTLAVIPFGDDPAQHVPQLQEFLSKLPPIGPAVRATVQAPILVVPQIFEPEFCQELIGLYEANGGSDSGFMRDRDGKTIGVIDYSHKRRMDYNIEEEAVRHKAMVRIHDRLVPEIHKAFQFHATRMERYIVACYEGETGGHFRAHRDNTTIATAHRRFAVSLNLNTGEYVGGHLKFPEFGPQLYSAPAGGAVVFSCSLLHEATPVTQGRRYVFLPFLYDDAAAVQRERGRRHLVPGVIHTADPHAVGRTS